MAAPAKLISTSIGFQDPKGNVVANGMLMLTLSQTATVTATGGQVTTEPIFLNLDANGKITSTAIWFIDELSPSGLIYYGVVYAANKIRMIPGLDKLQYSITGASFDLATAVQSGPASPSYSGAVMLNPTGQQNINGQTLNMEGASLSFSAAASTTADSFFSRIAAGIIGVGTAIGNVLGTLRMATLALYKSDGTVPATFTNDTAGGINFTSNSGKVIEFNTQGQIVFFGATSGTTIIAPTAIASGTLTLPAATDTLVGKATTDTLTNKTLQGAGSGNAVNLLNQQGPLSAVVGTGADANVYTYTITANTMQSGKGIRVKIGYQHTTGTASVTYKMKIGSTTIESFGSTDTNPQMAEYEIFNNSGVQNAQNIGRWLVIAGAQNIAYFTSAENFANAIAITYTFSVANTDQVTPKFFKVELIQ